MTFWPVAENHGHWWLTTVTSWNRLHAIPGDAVNGDEDTIVQFGDGGIEVLAVCGVRRLMTIPGVLSRFGMPRCAHCCARLGVALGHGTPVNEATR